MLYWMHQYMINISIHTTYGGDYERQEAALPNVLIACAVVRRRWNKLSTSLATTSDEFWSFDDPSAQK